MTRFTLRHHDLPQRVAQVMHGRLALSCLPLCALLRHETLLDTCPEHRTTTCQQQRTSSMARALLATFCAAQA
jgi:hypothetical protein